MEKMKFFEKAELLKNDVRDLRNAGYRDVKDIVLADGLVKDTNIQETIKMSSTDLVRFLYNTHGHMQDNGDMLFLVNKNTLCKIINDMQEEKICAVREACEKIRKTGSDETIMKENAADNSALAELRKEIGVLEDELHRMSLAKAIIVPTDNLYRSKEEYDTLREYINSLTSSLNEANERANMLYERNSIMRNRIIELEKELENLEGKYLIAER